MKPQDFFLTARDFFVVIVPGALLLLLAGAASPTLNLWARLQQQDSATSSNTLNLLICLACTYAVGTVIGGFGSRLDWFSDKITVELMRMAGARQKVGFGLRKIDKLRQTEALARSLEVALAPGIARISAQRRPWSTRAFWWNYLRLNCPAAMIELDRVEGQQKQFRSMTIGGAIMLVVYGLNRQLIPLGIAAVSVLFLAYSYWSHRNRFARRLFELSIVHAVPEEHFVSASEAFFLSARDWASLGERDSGGEAGA